MWGMTMVVMVVDIDTTLYGAGGGGCDNGCANGCTIDGDNINMVVVGGLTMSVVLVGGGVMMII